MHYFDFNQKIFQIGESSSLGLMTWGLGGIGSTSYRTLTAQLADDLAARPPKSALEVAERWVDLVWPLYSAFDLTKRFQALNAKAAHDPKDGASRTEDEEKELSNLRSGLVLGFCIAGYVLPERKPTACAMVFDPSSTAKPAPAVHDQESFSWWGVPNIVSRLVFGADHNLKAAVLNSGKWTGTPADLDAVVAGQQLVHASLPMRDAVDYVHSSIYCTIKAMKFSNFPQVCGGPIEIAVITTDRKFRWVRHKTWDAAIIDGEIDGRTTAFHNH